MAGLERVLIGTVGRPHGLRGEVTVRLSTDSPELRFADGASVVVGEEHLTVSATRRHQGVLLVSFAGVADRTRAQALQGSQVWTEVSTVETPLESDEFYDRHLIGLEVRDGRSVAVGSVVEVLHLPGQECLVVDVAGSQRMVPFVSELVPVVDVDAGFVQVADLPGLLEDLP